MALGEMTASAISHNVVCFCNAHGRHPLFQHRLALSSIQGMTFVTVAARTICCRLLVRAWTSRLSTLLA
jgi:hypothetical protein